MASVAAHYDEHLGPVYGWMLGDLTAALENARTELRHAGISSRPQGVAVDLGAGLGVHAIPLAELGFSTIALDSCAGLLEELRSHAGSLDIRPVLGNLMSFPQHCATPVDVILCMGDTLTHLPSLGAVEHLFQDVRAALAPGGTFLATFRDYASTTLEGPSRFIPVRSDEHRILTCFLEYHESSVMVHDILHVRSGSGWTMKVSAYPKLRLDPAWAKATLARQGLTVQLARGARGMMRLIGTLNNKTEPMR